jgi:hypothetical protein
MEILGSISEHFHPGKLPSLLHVPISAPKVRVYGASIVGHQTGEF